MYYKRGNDAKGPYTKITMGKDVNKLVDAYENFTRSDIKVQKTHGAPCKTLSEIRLKDTTYIDKYRSFAGRIMWYTTKVGPDVENSGRELVVHMSYPGKEHWKALGRLIGYLTGKNTKVVIIRKHKVINAVIFL